MARKTSKTKPSKTTTARRALRAPKATDPDPHGHLGAIVVLLGRMTVAYEGAAANMVTVAENTRRSLALSEIHHARGTELYERAKAGLEAGAAPDFGPDVPGYVVRFDARLSVDVPVSSNEASDHRAAIAVARAKLAAKNPARTPRWTASGVERMEIDVDEPERLLSSEGWEVAGPCDGCGVLMFDDEGQPAGEDATLCAGCFAELAEETDAKLVTDPETVRDLLLLADEDVPLSEVEGWTNEQRGQANAWATAVHLEASDNDVEVPARPDFLGARRPTSATPKAGA